MALSGSFQNLPVNNFGLYCTWSATQSVTGNYSDVTLNVYLKYYTLEVGSRADSTISINGTSETYTAPAINDYSSGQHTKLLKTKTVRVNHNADGTKSGVALSAYWRFSGTYSGTPISSITASTTITLDTIDRAAPTVSLSTSGITASGVTITMEYILSFRILGIVILREWHIWIVQQLDRVLNWLIPDWLFFEIFQSVQQIVITFTVRISAVNNTG